MVAHRAEATPVDRAYQVAYACAYRVMRTYWKLRHPTTHGALVALWNRGELLLVRNSYVPYYCLPGGYVRRGESGQQAALRELAEEVGVATTVDRLSLALEEHHEWEGKRDHVVIYALEVDDRPAVQVDHREVVEASWRTPESALGMTLFPPVRHMLERRAAQRPS